jgi:hypothetical protein
MKAFPTTKPLDSWGDSNAGMDLRDYFAAKAMVALTPIYREMFMDNTFEDWIGDATTAMVDCAYAIADEMMEARNK